MRKLIIAVSLLLSTQAWTQQNEPDWSVNPSEFNNSMSVVGRVKFNREFSVDASDRIAAIVNGKVRGVTQLQYEPLTDEFLAYLIIYGNQGGETINFTLYDADQDQVYGSYKTVVFQINGLIGNLRDPLIWSELSLNPEAELNEFDFKEVHGDLVWGDTIQVPVRNKTDISWLAAKFEVSERATVWVDDIEQKSGSTHNDFTEPVTYAIIAEDGQTTNKYVVKVIEAKKKMRAYPIPAKHKVKIKSEDEDDNFNIEFITIRDLSGRIIKKNVYLENNTLYVDDLKNGIYLMEFQLFNQTISLKFVKN